MGLVCPAGVGRSVRRFRADLLVCEPNARKSHHGECPQSGLQTQHSCVRLKVGWAVRDGPAVTLVCGLSLRSRDGRTESLEADLQLR